jgi:hypothetical protein
MPFALEKELRMRGILLFLIGIISLLFLERMFTDIRFP